MGKIKKQLEYNFTSFQTGDLTAIYRLKLKLLEVEWASIPNIPHTKIFKKNYEKMGSRNPSSNLVSRGVLLNLFMLDQGLEGVSKGSKNG